MMNEQEIYAEIDGKLGSLQTTITEVFELAESLGDRNLINYSDAIAALIQGAQSHVYSVTADTEKIPAVTYPGQGAE